MVQNLIILNFSCLQNQYYVGDTVMFGCQLKINIVPLRPKIWWPVFGVGRTEVCIIVFVLLDEISFILPLPLPTVYPSLESDDDDPALKSRPKKKKNSDDAPWSPKARVTPTLPKQDRPVREGTRVASIETGLAAAAAKLAQQELQKAQKKKYIKKKPLLKEVEQPRPQDSSLIMTMSVPTLATTPQPLTSLTSSPQPPPEPKQEALSGSLADHEYTARPNAFGMAQANRSTTPMAPGVFLTQRRPSVGSQSSQAGQGKRPKKGLATAKQRLGRILKIHRNGKLLL
nr:histone lysine demethylase PHF8-like [Meriones unguiculatus]